MNLQEREQIAVFLQQLSQAQANQKDPEADSLIRAACMSQPDAGYLLVQRAMQLEHALRVTQAQASQLQAELEQARTGAGTRFLADDSAWGRAVPSAPAPQAPAATPMAAPVMQPRGLAPAPAAAPAAGTAPSWGSGILGNVATTAAGVVAGSFLFQGIESLMGHHSQGGAWGANATQPTPVAQNTVINNYYGEGGTEEAGDATGVADAGGDSDGSDSA
jgi:hypothetical protein